MIKMVHDITSTDHEHDALTELVNIRVSRTASNLRQMIGEEVLFSVPSTEIMNGCGCHVLVVEDNIEVEQFSTHLLQELGYETMSLHPNLASVEIALPTQVPTQ
jgi:hypothetical protein